MVGLPDANTYGPDLFFAPVQQAAANELSRLNAEWQAGVRKNIEIEAACDALQEEVAVLTAKATEL